MGQHLRGFFRILAVDAGLIAGMSSATETFTAVELANGATHDSIITTSLTTALAFGDALSRGENSRSSARSWHGS
jgi:hypothetical protein